MELIKSLTLLDFIALTIILLFMIYYTLRGFFKGLLGILIVVTGLVMAGLFYRHFGSVFTPYVRTETIAHLLGFISIFGSILLVGHIVIYLLYKLIKSADLEWFDKMLGTIFGFVKGWLVSTILFLALTAFPVGTKSVRQAVLAPYLLFSARVAVTFVPRDLKDRFDSEYKRVVQFWNGVKS